MKLFNVPEYTYIRVKEDTYTPVGGLLSNTGDVLKFIKIDGMYSICKNHAGEVVHLAAYADVDIVGVPEAFPTEDAA